MLALADLSLCAAAGETASADSGQNAPNCGSGARGHCFPIVGVCHSKHVCIGFVLTRHSASGK